ncbi:MAG TPA: hypothetical protein VGL65_02575 [Gemmatimonadales bacterium]|jgi:hypothetical protein
MVRRALDFAQAHPQTDSGYTAVVARLQVAIAAADTKGVVQDAGGEREHAAIERRTALIDAIRSQYLVRLARLAKRAKGDHPELADRFTLPRGDTPHRTFLIRATGMLQDAIAEKDLLTSLGVGDTFIEELTQEVADLATATADAHAGRSDHVGAGAGLEQVASEAVIDVAVLDTYMRKIFATDKASMAAWRSAKNLAGPFKTKDDGSEPVAPEPEPVPAPVQPQPVVVTPSVALEVTPKVAPSAGSMGNQQEVV